MFKKILDSLLLYRNWKITMGIGAGLFIAGLLQLFVSEYDTATALIGGSFGWLGWVLEELSVDEKLNALQARIDALMFEYCPEEITPEQFAEWERHQQPASMDEVMIDGVRYVPDPMHADEVKFYYMHDDHTFSRLSGNTLDEVLDNAETMAKESRCGMLCPPVLLAGGKEVRRLKAVAHSPCCGSDDSKWLEGKEAWRKECETDSCVMRLVSSNVI